MWRARQNPHPCIAGEQCLLAPHSTYELRQSANSLIDLTFTRLATAGWQLGGPLPRRQTVNTTNSRQWMRTSRDEWHADHPSRHLLRVLWLTVLSLGPHVTGSWQLTPSHGLASHAAELVSKTCS